jgi:hypothetical protein
LNGNRRGAVQFPAGGTKAFTKSCPVRIFALACALWLAVAWQCGAAPQAQARRPTEIAVPMAEPGVAHFPQDQAIPSPVLAEMYRAELGKAYDPVVADQLDGAHQLLEKYVVTRSSASRKRIVQSLDAIKLSPDILGRLCRIRSDWPDLSAGGVFYVNQKTGAYPVRYFMGVPKGYDRTKSWPVAVTLVSAAPFLSDPPPDAQRVVELYTGWIQTELAKHPDALVLMPLLSLGELYGPSYAGMHSVMEPLFDAANHANIDPTRVYLAGISAGAQAAWNLALHQPTYFAAFDPLAGSAEADWQQIRLMNLRNVLPVVWHDDDDKTLKVNFSKSLVNALKSMKIDVDFLETKGIGHLPTSEIVETEYRKMRQRVRPLYPPQVWVQTNRPDVSFNRVDWVQIYQQLNTGKSQRLFFPRSSGYMEIYPSTCSIKAEIRNNVIEASTDNVDTLRFYVNDQMVNFAAPVTVRINKIQKFKGLLKPSVEEMLRDQTVLGRGWRYFTAVIDLSMTDHPVAATLPATRPLQRGRIIVGPSVND